MGSDFSNFWKRLFGSKDMSILILGLDGAGKTTILYKLKLGKVVTTIPTIGTNTEQVKYRNILFNAVDVGGQEKIRELWRHYYENIQGLVFVVDSSDRDRIGIARKELHAMLNNDKLREVAVLVLANKQDLSNAMTAAEVTDKLSLHAIRSNDWFIQSICATSEDGLEDGFDWLSKTISAKKN